MPQNRKRAFAIQTGACYIRVSTEEQTEYSPDAQMRAIKAYAEKHDIDIPQEYIFMDEGISGKAAARRPGFMKMIATAKLRPKPFDVILVHKFDRFARSREDSVVYKSLLKKENDIRVCSVTEPMEDDKFSVILEAMLEAMAEYYSLNLAEEVKKGMTEKAERGEHQSYAPIGYKMKNGALVVDEQNARYIAFIFEKFAFREYNVRQLAVYMNEIGVTSRFGNKMETRSVHYILNNPVYAGYTRWSPNGRFDRNWNKEGIIKRKGEHTPIVSEELWDKAQERMRENRGLYPKGVKQTHSPQTWLRGLVRCPHCGKAFVRVAKCKDTVYYNCNAYQKGACKKSGNIRLDVLEGLVLGEMKRCFAEPIEIDITPKAPDDFAAWEHELLTNTLQKLEAQLERAKIAYLDGVDSPKEYRENKGRINAEKERVQAKLQEGKDRSPLPAGGPFVKGMENVCELLTHPEMDMETKCRAAYFLIRKIEYYRDEGMLKIEFR